MATINGSTFDRAHELICRVHANAPARGLIVAGTSVIRRDEDTPWWFDVEFAFTRGQSVRVASLTIRDEKFPVADLAEMVIEMGLDRGQ